MDNLKIIETTLTDQQSMHIKQTFLPQIFSIENNQLKLSSEYKIIFLNEISCIKKYFIKNVCDEQINDVMCNIYKLDNWNDEKKKYMNKIIKVDSLYYLVHNLVLQDETNYYYIVFILHRDVNCIKLNENVDDMKERFEKKINEQEEQFKNLGDKLTDKIKKNNENFLKNYDEIKEMINKINNSLSDLKSDIIDLNMLCFPNGKGIQLL